MLGDLNWEILGEGDGMGDKIGDGTRCKIEPMR